MSRRRDVHRSFKDQQGITGLETAIILIAFVVVAAVFAFVVLSTGLFSSERSKEAVFGGLAKTRGTMTLSGSMHAASDGTELTDISFGVSLAAGGSPVNWDPEATNNKTIISFHDNSARVADLDYETVVVTGDTDELLEQGELFEITVTDVDAETGVDINENDVFTLEVHPVSGAFLVIERTVPPGIAETIVNLN